jgi:hypothetical protein
LRGTSHIFKATEVFPGHPSRRKSLLEYPSDVSAIQSVKCADCFDRLGFIFDDKARHTVIHNLLDGAATPSDHGRAASHGFNYYQPEWLRPVDWEEKSGRIPQEIHFGCVINLANEFYVPVI